MKTNVMMKTKTIKQKALISASPEEVYECFVDAKLHEAFTGSRATGSSKVGSRVTAWDGYITAKNIELKPNKKIVQEWRTTEWPAGASASKLTLTFAKKGRGTEITMVHSNVPAEQASSYAKGWKDFYWNPLKKYFKEK